MQRTSYSCCVVAGYAYWFTTLCACYRKRLFQWRCKACRALNTVDQKCNYLLPTRLMGAVHYLWVLCVVSERLATRLFLKCVRCKSLGFSQSPLTSSVPVRRVIYPSKHGSLLVTVRNLTEGQANRDVVPSPGAAPSSLLFCTAKKPPCRIPRPLRPFWTGRGLARTSVARSNGTRWNYLLSPHRLTPANPNPRTGSAPDAIAACSLPQGYAVKGNPRSPLRSGYSCAGNRNMEL